MSVIGKYFQEIPKDDYTEVCAICGYPLTKHLIAADISGQCVDYTDKCTGQVSFCLCRECFLKLKEYCEGGKDAAYRRMFLKCSLTDKKENV